MIRTERIQLSRRRGFKLQVESAKTNGLPAINCARPGMFGNPFKVENHHSVEDTIALFEEWLDGMWPDIEPRRRDQLLLHLFKLRTHNGACYCDFHRPCHVDVLLERAAQLK